MSFASRPRLTAHVGRSIAFYPSRGAESLCPRVSQYVHSLKKTAIGLPNLLMEDKMSGGGPM